jgi:hypothetical protein
VKSIGSIRRDNDSAVRRSRRGERVWAPGYGWISAAQQRALRNLHFAGEGRSWVMWSALGVRVVESTLRALERLGLVEIATGDWLRLTDDGVDVVRRWQEADAR